MTDFSVIPCEFMDFHNSNSTLLPIFLLSPKSLPFWGTSSDFFFSLNLKGLYCGTHLLHAQYLYHFVFNSPTVKLPIPPFMSLFIILMAEYSYLDPLQSLDQCDNVNICIGDVIRLMNTHICVNLEGYCWSV